MIPYYLTELYSPKDTWMALSKKEKESFFQTVGEGMAALLPLGITVITMGKVDQSKLYPTKETFFALWQFENEDALNALLAGIKATGWHTYFSTTNAAGIGHTMEEHLQMLSSL